MSCPCGSELDPCCTRYHAGEAAPTAEALMRSRYTAYVVGAIDYLVDTHDPATRGTIDREGIARWSRETQWLGLEIVAKEYGSATDARGVVEFIARGKTNGTPFEQRERSRFRKLAGRWVYVDGKVR